MLLLLALLLRVALGLSYALRVHAVVLRVRSIEVAEQAEAAQLEQRMATAEARTIRDSRNLLEAAH
jgi:hypothetical protein